MSFNVVSSCCLHCHHSHHHHPTIHTPVSGWRSIKHQLPLLPRLLPLPLSNAYSLPSPHCHLTVVHRHHHPPPLLPNAISVTVTSPPPHSCLLLPLSNIIVILNCHHFCCRPLLPSNADARLCHTLPLVSNTIFALTLPRLSSSMIPSAAKS